MKKMRDLKRDESGAVAVLVAACLTVLMGMTAFAVDFGMMAECKGELQNAADAAALAAAADLGAGSTRATVKQTAEKYCTANGFDPDRDDVAMTVQTAGKTVKVSLSREMTTGFSSVLTGQRTRSISAEATAEATSIFGGCPYAMFAGKRIEDDGSGITVTGNDITISGNIHSNSDISMRNATIVDGCVATAVRRVSISEGRGYENSIALDMPSFRSFQSALDVMPGRVSFGGNVTKSSKDGFAELVDEALARYHEQMGMGDDGYLTEGLFIHITGNLRFNGHNSTAYQAEFPIVLVVDGDIDLNGAPLNSTVDFPVSIMSKNGDITVNGGGATYTGILYAPEGDITLNGNDAAFVGSIVAQNIRKSGGKISVRYSEDADAFLPLTKVHLIE